MVSVTAAGMPVSASMRLYSMAEMMRNSTDTDT